jgi:cytochrome c-type biogenesis protein CcmH
VRTPLLAIGILAALLGCDRAVEPYVPGEQPQQPDLSRIFPEGAERATKDAPMGGGTTPMPGATSDRGTAPPAASAAGDAAPVSGTITLASGYERKVPAGAILFVVARTGQGGGPPLAVKRIESPRFPLEFSLGPDDRMIKQMPFVGPLVLSARLDTDGNAMTRAPGDLQGQAAGTHQPGESGVAIVIDQIL